MKTINELKDKNKEEKDTLSVIFDMDGVIVDSVIFILPCLKPRP